MVHWLLHLAMLLGHAAALAVGLELWAKRPSLRYYLAWVLLWLVLTVTFDTLLLGRDLFTPGLLQPPWNLVVNWASATVHLFGGIAAFATLWLVRGRRHV